MLLVLRASKNSFLTSINSMHLEINFSTSLCPSRTVLNAAIVSLFIISNPLNLSNPFSCNKLAMSEQIKLFSENYNISEVHYNVWFSFWWWVTRSKINTPSPIAISIKQVWLGQNLAYIRWLNTVCQNLPNYRIRKITQYTKNIPCQLIFWTLSNYFMFYFCNHVIYPFQL